MRFFRVGIIIFAIIIGQLPAPVSAAEDVEADLASFVDQQVEEVDELPNAATTVASPPPPLSPPHQQSLSPADNIVTSVVVQAEPTHLSPVITEIQVSGKCVLATCASSNSAEFVELFNPNDSTLSLTGYKLVFQSKSGTRTTLVTFGDVVMQPKQFVLVARDFAKTDIAVVATVKTALTDDSGAVLLMSPTASQDLVDQVAWGDMMTGFYGSLPPAAPKTDKSLQRCFINGQLFGVTPRDSAQEFIVYPGELPTPGMGIECKIPEPPLPVNSCEGLVINEIAANVADQFIELRNNSDHAIALDGCQLQTNRSTTKSYIFSAEMLPTGGLRVVSIKDTPLTLTKTTSGIVYLLSSDGLSEVSVQAYSDLAVDTSWAKADDGSWWQTYARTPAAENVILRYLPCEEGFIRNTDTGRCNKIVKMATVSDCGEGKYRSEDTGRCRTIPAASVLAACKLGQYRSEETNRCRNIVAASTVKPCRDNQYRSEETNRCRNLPAAHVPESAFAVQPVKDTAMAFVGWWALGGVSALAAGYAMWEWRREMAAYIRKITSSFQGKK